MKVCPKCAQSFADGFSYCPQDATKLERYDLRARVNAEDEFHFLLESQPLPSRLKQALAGAIDEIRRNPRAFLRGLLHGETNPRNRQRLLQAGFATGVIAYAALLLLTLLAGIFRTPYPNGIVDAAPPRPPEPLIQAIPLIADHPDQTKRAARPSQGLLGGSLPQTKPQRSAGGGGQNDERAASVGEMPTPSLSAQLNPPDLEPPKIKFATLVVPETVYADEAFRRRINGQFGLREGQPTAPSLGNGNGTGVGPGAGPGYGPGVDGNLGGDKFRRGSGPVNGTGNDPIPPMSASLKPVILYREKAEYTEDARQHKVEGAVVLSVVFGADGRIRNLRTIRGLPHGLTETAIEAAQRIRFQPAVQNGKPVSVQATLEFNFALY